MPGKSISDSRSSFSATLRAVLILLALNTAVSAQQTALDSYVAKKDSVYAWELKSTVAGDGFKAFILELTSQTWRSAAEVDRPVWKHWLTIVKPEKVSSDKALLFIGGGSNKDAMPKSASDRLKKFALETNTVVAELGMVPNQPLFFYDSKD